MDKIKSIMMVLFYYSLGTFFVVIFPLVYISIAVFGIHYRIIQQKNLKEYFIDFIDFPKFYIQEFIVSFFKLEVEFFGENREEREQIFFCDDKKPIDWKQIGF